MIRKLLAAGALILVTGTGANAAVIFDGGPSAGDFPSGSWLNIGQGQNFAVKVNFGNGVTVNGFDIYTNYYSPVLNNPVVLKIFAQDPSTISGVTPDKYFSTITDVQEIDFHAVNIAHANFAPIHLDAGNYWIGMASANTDDISWTSYRNSDDALNRPFQDQLQLAGDSFTINPGIYDLAFKIDGTFDAISGVPEPSTWAMFLLGFGAIGMALRSGRKSKVAVPGCAV